MGKVTGTCTVFFEEPFWVGVFERIEGDRLSVARFVFGAEPSDAQILQFVVDHYYDLKFGPAVTAVVREDSTNPKRALRIAKKAMRSQGVGTKSQQALKTQQKQAKNERKASVRSERLLNEKLLFELKQQKKRERRKGH